MSLGVNAEHTKAAVKILQPMLREMPPLTAIRVWIEHLVALDAPVQFVPRDERACLVARFLACWTGYEIDVGDDDLAFDGRFIREMPDEWKSFMRRFDINVTQPVGAREVLAAFDNGSRQ